MKWLTSNNNDCPDSNNHFKHQKETDNLYWLKHDCFSNEDIKRIIASEPDDTWLLKQLYKYMNMANEESGWNYSIDGEQIQLHNYRIGNQYRWHRDGICGHNSTIKDVSSPLHNLTRKLSMTVLLNDPSEFTGGEFKMKGHTIKDFEIKLNKGSVLVFPAWQSHSVFPVKTGERHSLPVFFYGRPFVQSFSLFQNRSNKVTKPNGMAGTNNASMISIGIHYQKQEIKSSLGYCINTIQLWPAFQTKENPPGKKLR